MRKPEKIQERVGAGGWEGACGRRALEAAEGCLSVLPSLDLSVLTHHYTQPFPETTWVFGPPEEPD